MNNWTLKTVPINKFGQEVIQASQLLTSRSIQDVCNSISKNLDTKVGLKSNLNIFHVSGLTGSGRTTFCKAVLKSLIQSRLLKESEIIYIKVDKHDNLNCVWNCGILLARIKNLGNLAALLSSKISTAKAKENAMVSVFDTFKVVCFDNLYISESNHQLYTLLMDIIHKLNTNIICVSKPTTSLPKDGTLVEVGGLNLATIGGDSNWQTTRQYLDTEYKSIGNAIRSNPKAVQMLVNASRILGTLRYRATANPSPVLDVLTLIWEHLDDDERTVLSQLSELRRALPLKDADSLSRLIQIGLVEYEAPGADGNLFGEVILSDCVQEFVLTMRNDDKMVKTKFDVFECWMVLLSEELVGLIEDARSHSWPFVPEKWQYVKNASQKESYNVKDLITMKVKDLPHLTHFDVLQEALHHSVLRKDHENMVAILFLIDRYIYWQGGSQTLLEIVDSIAKEKPQLPIAPQLVIRKARVKRTSGDLQGAEKVLDRLLNEKQTLGMWQYREEHDHHLVKAVCIQIKGEIQATLGHWYNSAVLFLDSVHLFKTLPKVDKKGLSCSLGLLVNTLQRMSVEEFKLIAQKYSLKESHPYIQAHQFANEAAELAIYTPLFYARHKRRAGEMLLEYSKITTYVLRSEYLTNALKELTESLAAHKTFDSLNSREQYYEFISALYKASCIWELIGGSTKLEGPFNLKFISKGLFYHYCRNQTSIVHDEMSKTYINTAVTILGLPSYVEIDDYFVGTTSSLVYSARTVKPAVMEASVVDRCAETIQTLTVDRFKTTVMTQKNLTGDDVINGQLDEDLDTFDDGMFDQGTEINVHECEVSSYDAVHSKWQTERTLVYIGEQLNLSEDKEGAQRDPYMVEYLSQDEPLGKYVAKRYKNHRRMKQYQEDVKCQMTARYYVGLFNEELYRKVIEVSPIQFLPVVMIRLLSEPGSIIYNVEPYMQGNFTKITNNLDWVEKEGEGSKLVLAFSHFTYEKSERTLLITDHQGWTTDDHLSTTFLTDPQIHSIDKTLYGTGNLGMRGINTFWKDMHKDCNHICRELGLSRPLAY